MREWGDIEIRIGERRLPTRVGREECAGGWINRTLNIVPFAAIVPVVGFQIIGADPMTLL